MLDLLSLFAGEFNIPVIEDEQKVWFFRTKAGQFYHDFWTNNYIALGWELVSSELITDINISQESKKEKIECLYPDEKRPGLILGQMDTFYNKMQENDLVVIPSSGGKQIAIGKIGPIVDRVKHKRQADEYLNSCRFCLNWKDSRNSAVLMKPISCAIRLMCIGYLSQLQLQIVLLDPAALAQWQGDEPGKDGGEDEGDQDKTQPVHTGNGGLGAGGDVADPAGIDADLSHQTAGAHAAGYGGTVHLQAEHAGGDRVGDGRRHTEPHHGRAQAADGIAHRALTLAEGHDHRLQKADVELLTDGIENGTHQQRAEKALRHGAHGVDEIAFGGEYHILPFQESANFIHIRTSYFRGDPRLYHVTAKARRFLRPFPPPSPRR